MMMDFERAIDRLSMFIDELSYSPEIFFENVNDGHHQGSLALNVSFRRKRVEIDPHETSTSMIYTQGTDLRPEFVFTVKWYHNFRHNNNDDLVRLVMYDDAGEPVEMSIDGVVVVGEHEYLLEDVMHDYYVYLPLAIRRELGDKILFLNDLRDKQKIVKTLSTITTEQEEGVQYLAIVRIKTSGDHNFDIVLKLFDILLIHWHHRSLNEMTIGRQNIRYITPINEICAAFHFMWFGVSQMDFWGSMSLKELAFSRIMIDFLRNKNLFRHELQQCRLRARTMPLGPL